MTTRQTGFTILRSARNWFSLFASQLLILTLLSFPALADVTRWCQGTYQIGPGVSGGTYVYREFSASGTDSGLNPNGAREIAFRKIRTCAEEHWNLRSSGVRPLACGDGFRNYPFTDMLSEVTEMICAANPGHPTLEIYVGLGLDGDRGCTGPRNAWQTHIASDYRVDCLGDARILPPAQSVEQMDRIQPPAEMAMAPLPNSRIPGNDISIWPVGRDSWQDCMRACDSDSNCRAWTFRDSFQGRPFVCLQKSAVSTVIPDTCCQSGIKP